MRAIARRVARLESRSNPQEDPEAKRLVEVLRKRRLARLGEDLEHADPLPPTNNGRPWTVVAILRSGPTRAVGSRTSLSMKTALLRRHLERLETVQDRQESNRRLKMEFAYLKQLPRESTGPRHIVTVGRRPDGREECEGRPGQPAPNHETARDKNTLRIYIVYAAETSSEIPEGNLENGKAIG